MLLADKAATLEAKLQQELISVLTRPSAIDLNLPIGDGGHVVCHVLVIEDEPVIAIKIRLCLKITGPLLEIAHAPHSSAINPSR